MWVEYLSPNHQSIDPIAYALLKKPVLSIESESYEKASGAMVVKLALAALGTPQRFFFVVPYPGSAFSQTLIGALLIGDFAYQNGPQSSRKKLLDGDILLITHSVGAAKEALKSMTLGGLPLSALWAVNSLSRYTASEENRPRVFVSNPGWVVEGLASRQLAAVVVDASHPRTVQQLPTILESIKKDIPLQIVVTPNVDQIAVEKNEGSSRSRVWFWDSEGRRTMDETLGNLPDLGTFDRTLLVSSDPTLDAVLANIYEQLAFSQKEFGGFVPLWDAWSIYHRLRQSVVPLAQSEEMAAAVYGALPLLKRIERLHNAPFAGDIYRETRWPRLMQGLRSAYQMILDRREPMKFWTVAARTQELLHDRVASIRIVVPTSYESVILTSLLGEVIDNWSEILLDGVVEIVAAREEARRLVEGYPLHTILAGFRTGKHRYLDAYPPYHMDILAYPHEISLYKGIHDRYYRSMTRLQDHRERRRLLINLGLRSNREHPIEERSSQVPELRVVGNFSEKLRMVQTVLFDSPPLDFDELASWGAPRSWDEDVNLDEVVHRQVQVVGPVVRVVCDGDKHLLLPVNHQANVYYPAVKLLQRLRADELRQGMHLVVLVDNIYDDLFDRLVEAIRLKVAIRERLDLEIWSHAKNTCLARHRGSRTALYQILRIHGLDADYSSLVGWYRSGEAEIIAPQQFSNFQVVADYSGLYFRSEDVHRAFVAVEHERQRRRNAGRRLHELLTAIAVGEGYDIALASSRRLGAEVEDILAAVDILMIQNVTFVS